MATIGQSLTAPESGWKRYDDSDANIAYVSGDQVVTDTNSYNGTYHNSTTLTAQFNFTGTGIRIIGLVSSGRTNDFSISIDGVTYTASEYSVPVIKQALVFEKTNLANKEHYVVLTGKGTATSLDAIDIDSSGTLKPYSESVGIIQKYLVQNGNSLKYYSAGWKVAGTTPVTDAMFAANGMVDLSGISEAQWKAIPQDSKILAYTETDKAFTADVTMHNLYDSGSKSYHGTGIIETNMEDLPTTRKTLMINADHEECTFKYSLDNGSTWFVFASGDVIDITSKIGTQLKIQINMPTDTAKLTAISYAWA